MASCYENMYVVVEVRMRTLDQFFEIEILTYSDITSHRVSTFWNQKRFYDRATEHRSQRGTLILSPP